MFLCLITVLPDYLYFYFSRYGIIRLQNGFLRTLPNALLVAKGLLNVSFI